MSFILNLTEEQRVTRLGYYNAERARGLMHEPWWIKRMAEEQEWFDKRNREDMIARGGVETSPGVWLLPEERKRRWWR